MINKKITWFFFLHKHSKFWSFGWTFSLNANLFFLKSDHIWFMTFFLFLCFNCLFVSLDFSQYMIYVWLWMLLWCENKHWTFDKINLQQKKWYVIFANILWSNNFKAFFDLHHRFGFVLGSTLKFWTLNLPNF